MLLLVTLLATSSPPVATPGSATPPQCHVFLRGFSAQGLAPREEYMPQMLADTVATEITKRSGCRVTTAADVKTLVDATAERALCGDDSASCTAEIGQALGVDTIVDGTIRVVGDRFDVVARAMSVKEAAVLHRGEVAVDRSGDALRTAAPKLAESLFVDPTPEARTGDRSALLWSGGAVLGGGALVALAGGGLALFMNQTLDDPSSLRATKESQQAIGLVGLGAIGVGAAAALVGGGLLAGGAL